MLVFHRCGRTAKSRRVPAFYSLDSPIVYPLVLRLGPSQQVLSSRSSGPQHAISTRNLGCRRSSSLGLSSFFAFITRTCAQALAGAYLALCGCSEMPILRLSDDFVNWQHAGRWSPGYDPISPRPLDAIALSQKPICVLQRRLFAFYPFWISPVNLRKEISDFPKKSLISLRNLR